MSKERLEEIQNEVNYAYRRDGSISTKAVTMPIEHYEHLYEQAERVQELENILEQDHRQEVLEGLYEQNKRYREALELVAAEYNFYNTNREKIMMNIARQALESEE